MFSVIVCVFCQTGELTDAASTFPGTGKVGQEQKAKEVHQIT